MFDLRNFIHQVDETIGRHNLGRPGAYRRWKAPSAGDEPREMDANPYGCADAANLLYTIGRFPAAPAERKGWVQALQDFQDAESGLFEEAIHHPIHTTAHCIAALELFDARPRYPLTGLAHLQKLHELTAFLDTLNWRGSPWRESHRGAGIYAAMTLAGETTQEWEEHYFNWLWQVSDPQTGLLRQGRIGPVDDGESTSIFPHLAGTFHYLFNMEYARRPLRYPEKLVDTCLEIYYSRAYPLGERISFAEIDWVYCLNRAVRQSGHRFRDSRQALTEFETRYVGFLGEIDPETDDEFNDLHQLFGAVCCLAELQQALPGTLRTQRPLRLVLDRRPFI